MPAPAFPSLSDPADDWHALHQQQSDWALRAYARLVSTLSADVQDKLRNTAEAVQPYVVIFGKTQVGKTTLLLDLMGVAPAQMAAISQVLRGGRGGGNSATATAMEYCRSTSERWGLDLPGCSSTQWLDSDTDVNTALGQLRKAMESGQLPAHAQPCVVHIPQRFFADAPRTAPQVRILDLPGDNPANQAEQQHVERMAQTYLPFADLILLVGRGDDLGFLQPGVVTLPGIEDWQAMPRRFRVVTTYSCSAQSIKDILRTNMRTGIRTDATQLRQRLKEQIQRFTPLSQAVQDDETLFFPLEFGTSWQDLAQAEPDLHAHLTPLIAQLRTALLQDIANATTPMCRLRSIWDTHHSVTYLREKKISAIEQQIKPLNEKKDNISGEINSWTNSINRAENDLENLNNELNNHPLKNGEFTIRDTCLELPKNYPPQADSQENCESLREMQRKYRQMLQSASITHEELSKQDSRKKNSLPHEGEDPRRLLPANALNFRLRGNDDCVRSAKYWRKVQHAFQAPDREEIEKIIDDEFFSIRTKLNDYWFDKYFKTASYQSDKKAVEDAGDAAKQQLTQLWRVAWILALQEVDQQLHAHQSSAQLKIYIGKEEKEKSCKQLVVVQARMDALHDEQQRIERTTEADVQRCQKFDFFLNEEYAAALQQKMDDIFTTDDDCTALLQLLSCVELKNQREELMRLQPTIHRA